MPQLTLTAGGNDISSYVFHHGGIRIMHGKQEAVGQNSPSSMTVDLINTDDRFRPGNNTGPYGTAPFKPFTVVTLVARWNSVNYTIFSGFIEKTESTADAYGFRTARITCFDNFAKLNLQNLISATLIQQTQGGQITQICTICNVSPTSIATGNAIPAGVGTGSALAMCQQIAGSTGCIMGRDHTATT